MTPVALVTGAARGIGAAICQTLVSRGWDVMAVDRCSPDSRLPYDLAGEADLSGLAERVARSAGSTAGRIETAVADVTDLGALSAAVSETERRFGGLDAAIAAAGVIAGGVPAWQVPEEQQAAVIETNLIGPMNLARCAIPALLRRPEPRRGRFVAVASAAASSGLPMLAVYCAAKAGVVGFIRSLSRELELTGVTANAVSPGSTDTAILAESARLYGLASAEDLAPHQRHLGRLLEPSEVAAAVAWLLSEEATAVTGINLPVDGGFTG